jgi:hypothetical protein
MKLPNHESHDHSEQKESKGIIKRVKQYWKNLYQSNKLKMPRGCQNIFRCIPCARNENWRRNHQKSLNKHHK